MAKLQMTDAGIKAFLQNEWILALDSEDMSSDPEIDVLVNSNVMSIRYALVTQLLGKIADPARSLFALQLKAGDLGAWDARSFSTSFVVPW